MENFLMLWKLQVVHVSSKTVYYVDPFGRDYEKEEGAVTKWR